MYFPNRNKGADGPIIKWIPTNKGASIKLDHKKWEQMKSIINFDSIFRPYWEGRVPLEESSFKALHNPKWCKMKANQVDITSKMYAEAFVKHMPNPKELMDYKTKERIDLKFMERLLKE